MSEEQNLKRAINLAQQLFGMRSFRWVDPLNVRIGRFWLGRLVEDCEEGDWGLFRCELGKHDEPTGPLLEAFEDVEHGVAALVGVYATEVFHQAMLQRIMTEHYEQTGKLPAQASPEPSAWTARERPLRLQVRVLPGPLTADCCPGADIDRCPRKESAMLVLSRAEGDGIVFPELGIKIKVFDCRDGRVRVGIEAPRSVTVHREEVQLKIDQAQQAAEPTVPEKLSA